MNNADVKEKISGVRPVGVRDGYTIYRIRDVAPKLMKPEADMVERILNMHPNELPKMLAKEWWMAQNHRLTYQQRTAELWATKRVVDLAGQAFKTLRLSLVLLADTVERESGLSPVQREIIGRLVNVALEEMREKLVRDFEHSRASHQGAEVASEEASADAGDL